MSSPKKVWEETPLKPLVETAPDKPGIYLIALRAHLKRGKTMIGNVFESVADVFPKSAKAPARDDV